MSYPNSTELAGLPPAKLTEALVALGLKARTASTDGDTEALRSIRRLLLEAGDLAAGESAHLLAVAGAFVRALGRTELSGRERALRTFLRDHAAGSEKLVALWLKGNGLSIDWSSQEPTLGVGIRNLVAADVVREASGRFWLTDEARAIAAELLEPMPLRLWREVENSRRRIEELGSDESVGAELLAARFGVETEQAREFLKRHPVEAHPIAAAIRRDATRKRIWTAENFRATPKKPLDNASEQAALAEVIFVASAKSDNARKQQPTRLASRDENSSSITQLDA